MKKTKLSLPGAPAHHRSDTALIYEYYDGEWRTDIYICPLCGWSGTCEHLDGPNTFRELMDYGCPTCDKMLLIINYPTYRQTLEAAARGNEHAIRELGIMSGEGEHWEEFKRKAEEYNQGLRDKWDRFEGAKKLVG